MKRIALAALVGAALSVGAASSHAQQAERAPNSARTENRNHRQHREAGSALLRGIQLTDTQRERIKQIHESFRPQQLELRQSMKGLREKRERPDSATLQRWKELAQREQSEIRAALTPEQRTTFDGNVKQLREHAGKRRR